MVVEVLECVCLPSTAHRYRIKVNTAADVGFDHGVRLLGRSAAQELPDDDKLPRYRSDIYRNLIMRAGAALQCMTRIFLRVFAY